MMERIKVTERISYIKAETEPLSADVILIEGDEYFYLFDVGNAPETAQYLQQLTKPCKVILSHFHQDHMGNLGRVPYEVLYTGKHTEKYINKYCSSYETDKLTQSKRYVTVTEEVRLFDGIELVISPIPASHARGCLALSAEGYLFLGDALYPAAKGDGGVYNVQLLKEEIAFLNRAEAQTVFSSHEKRLWKPKAVALRFLDTIYGKREKNETYVPAE